MPEPEGRSGGGLALAFCIGGAFAALVLLPTTQLLDPKAAAAMGLASLFCLGLALPKGGSGGPRKPPGLLFLAWAPAGLALSACWAASPYRTLVNGVDGVDVAAVCVCLCLAAGPRLWLDAVLRSWRWSTLALAAYALAQRLGLEPFTAYALAGSRLRAMGSFGNAGYLAAFLCLSWPLFLDWAPLRRAAALALVFAALVGTQSRAALLALGVQGALLVFVAWRRVPRPGPEHPLPRGGLEGIAGARAGTAVAAAGMGLLGLLAASLFPYPQWFRPTLRRPLWQAAFHLWLRRPWLGWGPGSFALAFQDHADPALVGIVNAGRQYAEDPHQLLLAVACAGGLLGLAVLGLACALFLLQAVRSPLPEAPALGLGAFGLLVQSQADRFFFQPGVFVPLCAAFGLLAWREEGASGLDQRSKPRKSPGAASEGLGLVFLALAFCFAWRGFLPLLRYRQGVGASLDAGVGVLSSARNGAVLDGQALGSPDPMTLERLGDALAAGHHYGQAAKVLARALALQPTRGRAQNLGDCYMMLGEVRPAEAAFRRAVELEPASADAHFSLGYALFYQKRLKEAVAELDTALRLDPSHAGAMQLKRQILQ